MTKKYRLLKDQNCAKAGAILEKIENQNCVFYRFVEEELYKEFGPIIVPDFLEKEWLEPIQNDYWRAERDQQYSYISDKGNVYSSMEEDMSVDKERYLFCNYFHGYGQAEEAARRVRKVLEEYHKEIGE